MVRLPGLTLRSVFPDKDLLPIFDEGGIHFLGSNGSSTLVVASGFEAGGDTAVCFRADYVDIRKVELTDFHRVVYHKTPNGVLVNPKRFHMLRDPWLKYLQDLVYDSEVKSRPDLVSQIHGLPSSWKSLPTERKMDVMRSFKFTRR